MPMKNSRLADDFVARWVAENPIHTSPKTGNIVTCPVRLSWINLFQPGKPQTREDGTVKEGNYNVQLWFPPGAEAGIYGVMVPELIKGINKGHPGEWPRMPENPFGINFVPEWLKAYNAAVNGQGGTILHQPFRDQKTQEKYGATPGLPFITASTQNKPQVTDPAGNPIVDEKRVYPGVWGIVSLNVYQFGFKPKQQPKRGYQFGLQSVMIVGDDEPLGASAPPAADDFADVKISQSFAPDAAFGMRPAAAPPASVLPPSTPAYAAPSQGYAPPPGPPPGQPAAWAPPAGQTPPPAPAPSYLPKPVMPVLPVGVSMEDLI